MPVPQYLTDELRRWHHKFDGSLDRYELGLVNGFEAAVQYLDYYHDDPDM